MSDNHVDLFRGVGVPVKLKKKENYLVVKETLERIGVSPKNKKVLYQSCHILHKNEQYIIAHFKELFKLDNLKSDVSEEDILRRNAIINLLEEWDLIEVLDPSKIEQKMKITGLKILRYDERDDWDLIPKFNTGTLRKFFSE
jgi:hypothetical protein